ncbi:hypothetical protein FHETE_943 [Fusarium heterosporum]|uniref:Uncharacterized protein n=1 Tax=Fusarium heterosporum TaxID=42747 RepID=A0A8H5WXF1_FUSHE|nr:hypothetical protein FHETE_943 [Fusarium heterosporum]
MFSAARLWVGLSPLVLSVIVSQANALVFSVANNSRDATRTTDGLATITPAPGVSQDFEVNTCSYYNATESRTLWNNPWCSMYVGTVDLVFWPTTGNHSYPSTYRDTVSDYTFTSPSVYMIVNTMYAENPCGPLGPSASREIFAFDLTEVSTLVPYTDDIASTRRATRQLYLSDLGTHCTRSFNRTELATQTRPTKDDDTRCNPFLTVPKKFKEYGYPYWLHCGIKNNRFGVFDPPYAIPALDELIPAHTTSVQDHSSKNPTAAPSATVKAPTNAGSAEPAVTSLHDPKPTLALPSGDKPVPVDPVNTEPDHVRPSNTKSAPGDLSGADPSPTIPGQIEPSPEDNDNSNPTPGNSETTNPEPAGPGDAGPAPVIPGTTKPDPMAPGGTDIPPTNPDDSDGSSSRPGHSKPVPIDPGNTKPVPVDSGGDHPGPAVPGGTDPTPANPDNAGHAPGDKGNTNPVLDTPGKDSHPPSTGDTDHFPSSPVDVKPAPVSPSNGGGSASATQGHTGPSDSLKDPQATAVNSGNSEASDAKTVADPARTGASDGLGVHGATAGGSQDAEATAIGQVNGGTDDKPINSKEEHSFEGSNDIISHHDGNDVPSEVTGSTGQIPPGETLQSAEGTSKVHESLINNADPTVGPNGATSTVATQVMSLGTAGLEVINKDTGETSTYAVPVAGASQPDGGLIPASVAVYSGHTVTQGGPALTVTNAIVVSLYPESSTGTSESPITTGGNASSATISMVPDSPASHFTSGAYSFVLPILAYGWMHL